MNYSVLTSIYAKEKSEYLIQSIESMLTQTIPPEQIVIVKDGPLTEELDSVIDTYLQNYSKIFTVVTLKENSGLAIALDAGLKHCRNEIVARMDTDDISLPERCEKQLKRFAENEKLAVLGTNIDEFSDSPENVQRSRIVPSEYNDILKRIRRREPFNHPTVMFKKSQVIRCGGYGTLRRCQDFDLFSRMMNMGCYAENINESLLLFRADENNYKRRKGKKSIEGYMTVMKLNYKRGYCSWTDMLYARTAQLALMLMPTGLMKWVSDNFLRKKKTTTKEEEVCTENSHITQ